MVSVFRWRAPRLGRASLLAIAACLLSAGLASAHEQREVGSYEFTVGFVNEPAIVEEPNGLSLEITTGEGDAATPVEGAANTLEAEVVYGDQSMPLELRAAFGAPGLYQADFIPTAEGAYTFHIFGSIEGNPIDERFTSGPETFSEVESRSTMSFPVTVEPASEIAAEASDAADSASTAMTVGIVGLIAGVLGLIVGIVAFLSARGARASDESAGVSIAQRDPGN